MEKETVFVTLTNEDAGRDVERGRRSGFRRGRKVRWEGNQFHHEQRNQNYYVICFKNLQTIAALVINFCGSTSWLAKSWKQFCFDPSLLYLCRYTSRRTRYNTSLSILKLLTGPYTRPWRLRYNRGTSNGQPCPPHKGNSKTRTKHTGWLYNTSKKNCKEEREEPASESWKHIAVHTRLSCESGKGTHKKSS